MRIAIDTSILLRAVLDDEPEQAEKARRLLAEAELIAIPTTLLCELVWVLRQGYRLGRPDIGAMIERLCGSRNVRTDSVLLAEGLAQLRAGGDFADGVMAAAGRSLGGETFVSFDREAVALLTARGQAARLP